MTCLHKFHFSIFFQIFKFKFFLLIVTTTIQGGHVVGDVFKMNKSLDLL